ncbi:MAG: DUF4383 domain-containing protein [Terracidiphilus sp.]
MKTKLSMLSKWTVAGLIGVAVAIWMQWLSGDPAFPKFPPGPVFFLGVAAILVLGARWWWTPSIGALIALFVTSGWFVRLPFAILRLTHPGSVGKFAAGIWIGAALQIVALGVADVGGLAATVQNYRRSGSTTDGATIACRLFGGLLVLMGILTIVGGSHGDKFHNFMHLIWGVLALIASFLGLTFAKRFSIGSGIFYLLLAILGLLLGNPSMNRAWYFGPMLLNTGDHIFHLVLGSIFLGVGLLSGREWRSRPIQLSGN